MKNARTWLTVLVMCWALLLPARTVATVNNPLPPDELLRHIDQKMSFTSDYKGTIRLFETRRDGSKRGLEVEVYRREKGNDLLFVSTQPRHLAGMGTLRIGRNLWDYDPTTGSWRRLTQRTNLLNTFTCEADFDRSRLAEDYTAVDDGEEIVNGVKYRKLLLTATNTLVSFAVLRLWVDPENHIVKRVGYTSTGRLLRTDIVRSYQRIKDPLSGKMVLHFKEVLETEPEEGTQMVVRYDDVTLAPLEDVFTKSWLESRIR